jgi:hypothetical protein
MACHNQSPKPQTLEQWYKATRDEEKSYYALQADLTQARMRRKGGGYSRLGEMSQDAKGNQRKCHSPHLMLLLPTLLSFL